MDVLYLLSYSGIFHLIVKTLKAFTSHFRTMTELTMDVLCLLKL